MEDILQISGLRTSIASRNSSFNAVDGVSLRVGAGEAVGLVGESGCGKSMTALSIMRLLPPGGSITAGEVRFRSTDLVKLDQERMRAIRGRHIGMIFQDPMTFLNPLMRVGDQIAEALVASGRNRAQAQQLALEALERVRMPRPGEIYVAYPHQLSGGMRQRVLIAIAVACRPSLLIADEPTTALDVTLQGQIMDLLAQIRSELGSASIMITHDLGLVARYCDRVYVMYAGKIVEEAETYELFAAPQHPYTRLLLRSTLRADRKPEQFHTIPGHPPDLRNPPPGCRFHPRCDEATEACRSIEPELMANGAGQVACLLRTGSVS